VAPALVLIVGLTAVTALAQSQGAAAPLRQQPAPAAPAMLRLSLDDAVRRALERNPSVALAVTNIARAEQLLQQARAVTLPFVSAGVVSNTFDASRGFNGQTFQPQTQLTIQADAGVPILAASQWAAVGQARDQIRVATLSTAEVRQQIAVSTAQAYLAVIAAQRQVDVEVRSLDNAKVHLDYAQKRLEGGVGSRLNQLRAAQLVSTEETRIEAFRLALLRAQEGLGVLVVENGPVDAASDPAFDVPPVGTEAEWMAARPDIQFQRAVTSAAERVVRDNWRDWLPTASANFVPQLVRPAGLFQPANTWRLTLALNQSIYEGGERKATMRLREISVDQSKLQLTDLEIQARSEVRLSEQALQSFERALTSARQAADQANEVLRITTLAFEVGATTNLEVIDAQREARDTETARALAEDGVRRAQLDLLVALGRFPK
jgi:outer membrane protein TolC